MSIAREAPTGWTKRRLRFDASLNAQKSKLDLPADTEVSFVRMESLGEFGGLTLNETRPIEEVFNGYTYFADGDVCIGTFMRFSRRSSPIRTASFKNSMPLFAT
jgi:hypothetical protein